MIHQKITHIFGWVVIVLLLSGCEQARVDAQMAELCKKDGGMKIYEKVFLPKNQYQYGVPAFLGNWKESGKAGGGYKVTRKIEEIKLKKPTLTKVSYAIIRDADQKILGTLIYYYRIGGDIMWRPGPDSSKSCFTNTNENVFLNSVFVQTDQEK